ncbi:NAD(P)/FAD-dependent oxidoreductase [Demequina soli]|uniref:NAD(P)/FAD-dependent oxidoreductase n=1 Tax=Demequina soli TaxID=1638987 RepID=UPI0007842393|nr:NAD(P)/FAD-dependent oxidoreductase [Demequina soli]
MAGTAHRVVIVGGGFAGLFAARGLRRAAVEVVLIDRTGFHLFQPLLYQVATGILSQGEIARPLREVLRRQRNARLLLGEVQDVDLVARTVTSSAFGAVTVTPYDTLMVATGATHSYFGNETFREHAPGLKTVDDALAIRARIYEAFERAESATDHAERCRHLTFVVVGGGPTGVEVAGQIAELSARSLRRNFRSIDPADARVVLLEAGPALLPAFGPVLSARARRDLEAVGVEVLLGARVTGIDATEVRYTADGQDVRMAATTKVWAAGVAASPLGGALATLAGAQAARGGRVEVAPDLTLPGHPEVFVLGDLASMPGVPGLAQAAIQAGRYAARVVAARVDGREPPAPFRYRDKGNLATIARLRAVVQTGRIRLVGPVAWAAWLGVHLVTLNGYRNRVTVTMHWAATFLAGARAERAATAVQARHAAAAPVPVLAAMEPSLAGGRR